MRADFAMPLPKSVTCSSCKKTYPEGWKRCPYCGHDEIRNRQEAQGRRFMQKKMQEFEQRTGKSRVKDERHPSPTQRPPRERGDRPQPGRGRGKRGGRPQPPQQRRDASPKQAQPDQKQEQQQRPPQSPQLPGSGSKRRRRRRGGDRERGQTLLPENRPQQPQQTPHQPRPPQPPRAEGESQPPSREGGGTRRRRRFRRRRPGGGGGGGGENSPPPKSE
ncbi:MAG: hypothetical protein JJE51_03805 [Thermoanaerobaculia bacterium]|nr:hypothetical protein [Thermoanaerobaculia bacterium]